MQISTAPSSEFYSFLFQSMRIVGGDELFFKGTLTAIAMRFFPIGRLLKHGLCRRVLKRTGLCGVRRKFGNSAPMVLGCVTFKFSKPPRGRERFLWDRFQLNETACEFLNAKRHT